MAGMMKDYLLAQIDDLLGSYMDYDKDNLQVGLWAGTVELHNAELRRGEALAKLRLPLDVRGGFIKYVQVKIPWGTRIYSEPVEITVDTLLLLVTANRANQNARASVRGLPRAAGHGEGEQCLYHVLGVDKGASDDEIDTNFARRVARFRDGAPDTSQEDEYEELLLAHKVLREPWSRRVYDDHGLQAVQTVEQAKQGLKELVAGDKLRRATQEQPEDGYLDRLWKQVLDNMQVTVKNVHLRFELDQEEGDDARAGGTAVPCPIAMGLKLGSLALVTADAQWRPTYVDRASAEATDTLKRRLGSVEGCAVYCHSPGRDQVLTRRFTGRAAAAEAETGVQLKRAFEGLAVEPSSCLVKPFGAEMHVTLSQPPEPRLHVDARVRDIGLGVSRAQVNHLVVAAQQLATVRRSTAFLQFRPAVPRPRAHSRSRSAAAAWWRYAVHWARWQEPRPGVRAIADPARFTMRRMGTLVLVRT